MRSENVVSDATIDFLCVPKLRGSVASLRIHCYVICELL